MARHVHERERRGGAQDSERQAVDEARHAAPDCEAAPQHPDELMHVRAVAYLADGVTDAKRIGQS